MNSFYSAEELSNIGFASFGKNVLLSRKASIYKPEAINLGNNVRIDDFCILSGGAGLHIGNYIHISAYSALYAGSGITIDNFSGLSPRCTLFSESDDFSGKSLVGPFFTAKEHKPHYISGAITLNKYVQIGCNSTIMPGTTLHEGVAIGAHSLVTKSCSDWGIYTGTPARYIKKRNKDLIHLADSA
jgi:galactoside O-acetyltransferase